MQYKVIYDNNPESMTSIEAPTARDAAIDCYLKQPPTRRCYAVVIDEDGSQQRFHTSELEPSAENVSGFSAAQSAVKRYRDAYLVAGVTCSIGGIVKGLGIIFGIIIVIAGFGLASYGPNGALQLAGFVAGAIVGIPIYVLGVLVSAQGQHLKASLDQAVHTSPFLDESQKARAMSLQ